MGKGLLSKSYDYSAAATLVDNLAENRCSLTGTATHAYPVGKVQPNSMDLFEETQPRVFRLVTSNTTEECMFRVIGVLSLVDFPLMKMPTVNDRLRHRTQNLGLIGCGSASFSASIEKLNQLIARLERIVPNGMVEHPLSFLSKCSDFEEIIFKCRYVTTGPDARHTLNVEIAPLADYNGYIGRLIERSDIRYAESNKVLYQRALSTSSSGTEYRPTSPIEFQPGDIVEVGFTVVAIPVSGNVKVLLVQNSVTLLDDTLSTAALVADRSLHRNTEASAHRVHSKTTKRKAGFFEVDEEDADMKVARQGVQHLSIRSGQAREDNTNMTLDK